MRLGDQRERGIVPAKPVQPVLQENVPQPQAAADGELALGTTGGHVLARLAPFRDQQVGVPDQPPAFGRQPDVPPQAIKEARAEHGFKLLDPGAYGGLSQVQRLGRPTKVPGPVDFEKRA